MPSPAVSPSSSGVLSAFPVIVEAFLDWARVERGFAASTIVTYRRSIASFIKEANVPTVDSITADHVTMVKRRLMDRGYSVAFIALVTMAVRSLLMYCRDVVGIHVLDPTIVKPPRRPRRPVTFLNADEVERLVHSIKVENQTAGRPGIERPYRPGIFFRALVEVLLGTGMRISEAKSLKKRDIDWVKREAQIIGKGNKSRTVFFTQRSLRWLKEYLDLRSDTMPEVFVSNNGRSGMQTGTVHGWFRRQTRRAGLNKKVSPHILRHTVATTLMFNGCPMGHIKEILGHERLDTTCRYYLGLDQREARKAHEKYLRYGKRDPEPAALATVSENGTIY